MRQTTIDSLALQERTRREILNKSDLIPPLPDFVVRLLALLNKPETEPKDLEQSLHSDQVLVAKMLAMVNSPFYGLNRSIRTIKEAVMVLGFRGVRSLVLASSTSKFMQRDFSVYGHDQKGLWIHAAAVAFGAKHLAKRARFGVEASEQVFIAGLLHDIGKLLLLPYLTDAVAGKPPATESAADLETSMIGLDHTEAGALVAAKWNLTPQIQDVIKQHHDAGTGDSSTFLAIVRLANAIAHAEGFGYLPGRAPRPVYLDSDVQTMSAAGSWEALREETAATMASAVAAIANIAN